MGNIKLEFTYPKELERLCEACDRFAGRSVEMSAAKGKERTYKYANSFVDLIKKQRGK